jgi:hypothetical protein
MRVPFHSKTVMVAAPHSQLGAVTLAAERDAAAGAQKAKLVMEVERTATDSRKRTRSEENAQQQRT